LADNGNGKDWEAIEREYRAGQLSIKEIARRYDCSDAAIHQRKKRDEANGKIWRRALSDIVRRKIKERLVSDKVSVANVSDDEISDEAANRGVEIINLQRQDILALRELEASLIKELRGKPTKLYLAQFQGKIIQKVVALTVAERSMAANNLANVQHKRVQLERQAYNLGDGPAGDDPEPKEIPYTVVPSANRKDPEDD